MRGYRNAFARALGILALVTWAVGASAQTQTTGSPWVIDVGIGIDPSINGNVNSGGIGTLQGQATAILPNPYGDVYGTGIGLHFGGGYILNEQSEVRGMFTYQSADADLVRFGDIGPSSLYGQYSDYKTIGLDVGYRRYFMPSERTMRPYGEMLMGLAFVDRINVQFAAPSANIVFNSTDFYDSTAAFTWNINFGLMFRVSDLVDLNTQLGLRHVGGLSQVDQFVGTGLDDINNDTARLTVPLRIGVRFKFK